MCGAAASGFGWPRSNTLQSDLSSGTSSSHAAVASPRVRRFVRAGNRAAPCGRSASRAPNDDRERCRRQRPSLSAVIALPRREPSTACDDPVSQPGPSQRVQDPCPIVLRHPGGPLDPLGQAIVLREPPRFIAIGNGAEGRFSGVDPRAPARAPLHSSGSARARRRSRARSGRMLLATRGAAS